MLTMYRAAQITNEALKSVKPLLIHKYWLRTQRIVEAYRTGAKFGEEEYKKKVYTNYRRVRVAEVEGDLEPGLVSKV
jgi:hypothetical protein